MSSLPLRHHSPASPRSTALTDLTPRIRLAAVLALGAALLASGYLLTDRFGATGLTLLALHAALPAMALPVLLCAVRGRHRQAGMILLVVTAVGAALIFVPVRPLRVAGVHGHALAGLLACGTAVAAWVRSGSPTGQRSRMAWLVFALSVLPALAVYAGVEARRTRWTPPPYRATDCYRFLTATTVEQAGAPNFPSALRLSGEEGTCLTSGCHTDVHAAWQDHAHALAGSNPAYRATHADFTRRRGEAAGRWCQGCHNPESQRGPTGAGSGGVGCLSCHGAQDVRALYGSAALELEGGESPSLARLEAKLRPEGHRHRNFRGGMQRSAEFCASCHRKNWSLPQNGFHWMPGPDEYRQWLASPFSGESLLTTGEAGARKSCVGCHDPHASSKAKPSLKTASPLTLDLFIRYPKSGSAVPAEQARDLEPGWTVDLDVVVRNTGLGHDFPYGMPDLQTSWVAVEGLDSKGKVLVRSGGREGSGTATYTLIAADAQGRPVRHGDLDRMTTVREWRRIPSGEADLARYRFRVPPGLASLRVRMLRQRRPEFSRWAGEPVQAQPAVVAETSADLRLKVAPGTPLFTLPSFRSYGLALARARLYPQAFTVLNRALELVPNDGETLLTLGRVFLWEGDLLAAGERFTQAQAALPEPSRAWQAVVARRSGQPEQAVRFLEPLVGRYPRDPRLRFELGRALLELLRHEEAARQFEALLEADPLDVAGHHNLMLCWQRLNRPADARREEALYRLLVSPDDRGSGEIGTQGPAGSATLRVFGLEAAS